MIVVAVDPCVVVVVFAVVVVVVILSVTKHQMADRQVEQQN